MLSFISVTLVAVSLHSNKPQNKKLVLETEYCCDRFDQVVIWRNVDFGTLSWEGNGML